MWSKKFIYFFVVFMVKEVGQLFSDGSNDIVEKIKVK